MKKILLMLVVAFTAMAASAQIYVGGGLNVWHDDDADQTVFKLAPSVGYELSEKWAIGGELVYEYKKDIHNQIEVSPYARWSYYKNNVVRLFLDMGFGVAVTKPEVGDSHTGWRIGAQPGIAVHLNKNFAVIAKCGFAGFADEYGKQNGFGVDVNGENLTFGIEYTF